VNLDSLKTPNSNMLNGLVAKSAIKRFVKMEDNIGTVINEEMSFANKLFPNKNIRVDFNIDKNFML